MLVRAAHSKAAFETWKEAGSGEENGQGLWPQITAMFPPEGQKLSGVQTWGGVAMPPSATFHRLAPGKRNTTLSLPKDEGTVSYRKTGGDCVEEKNTVSWFSSLHCRRANDRRKYHCPADTSRGGKVTMFKRTCWFGGGSPSRVIQ